MLPHTCVTCGCAAALCLHTHVLCWFYCGDIMCDGDETWQPVLLDGLTVSPPHRLFIYDLCLGAGSYHSGTESQRESDIKSGTIC